MREGRGEDVIRVKGGCRGSTPPRGLRVAAVGRPAATRIHDQEVKSEERRERILGQNVRNMAALYRFGGPLGLRGGIG